MKGLMKPTMKGGRCENPDIHEKGFPNISLLGTKPTLRPKDKNYRTGVSGDRLLPKAVDHDEFIFFPIPGKTVAKIVNMRTGFYFCNETRQCDALTNHRPLDFQPPPPW